jgi:hypothetical protein
MSVQYHLRQLFENHIPVMSIAEKLLIFREDNYREEMRKRNFQSAVIASDKGLLKYDEGDVSPSPLTYADLLSNNTPLLRAFEALMSKRRFFIRNGDEVDHIVTQSDLDKIPMRLALFGLISALETNLRQLVKEEVPDWQQYLSQERLTAAHKLLLLKSARNEEIDLLQCLQLADLGSIFSKKRRYKKFDPCLSRDQYNSCFGKIGKLRDAVAHSQQILPFSWSEIHGLLVFIRKISESKNQTH